MQKQERKQKMKKTRVLLLCLTLILALSATMLLASCNGSTEEEGTQAVTSGKDTSATGDTTDAPASDTAAPAEDGTEEDATTPAADETSAEAGDETAAPSDEETAAPDDANGEENYPEDEYIVIRTAEDLMALNNRVNVEEDDLFEMTVIFLADIDLEGYEWTPLDGSLLSYVTFDGQGHTIKNMTINYNIDRTISEDSERGCGFVGIVPAGCDLTFQNITFDNATIVARERHVGCLVGRSNGGNCTFENVTVRNFTVDGWLDYTNQSEETDGYPIAFRVAGIMGASFGGNHTFTNVTVENLDISGFHNLAGMVGYDASGLISEYSFENCKVENAKMTFSYCLSDSYTADMPRKFVSVFYNGSGWVDNIDECVEQGNTYTNVSFYDWADNNTEYTPDEFRSWTQEEKDAAG
jgi:hypothetical protein